MTGGGETFGGVDPCMCPACGADLESLAIEPDGPGVLVDRCVCPKGHEYDRVFVCVALRARHAS
ncbi:MAG TPA: hypothetical protein VI997_06515 [Candidatus Thermoplasmatota archaeon]|nr:hypothetical protein [Candidatus Thermoplasmatota archaeon]